MVSPNKKCSTQYTVVNVFEPLCPKIRTFPRPRLCTPLWRYDNYCLPAPPPPQLTILFKGSSAALWGRLGNEPAALKGVRRRLNPKHLCLRKETVIETSSGYALTRRCSLCSSVLTTGFCWDPRWTHTAIMRFIGHVSQWRRLVFFAAIALLNYIQYIVGLIDTMTWFEVYCEELSPMHMYQCSYLYFQ